MEAAWHAIWQGVRADFSDVPGIVALTQLVLRMLLASLLGGLLGYQREWQGKAAGLRTHMLVALGQRSGRGRRRGETPYPPRRCADQSGGQNQVTDAQSRARKSGRTHQHAEHGTDGDVGH